MSVKKKRTIGPCRGVTWLYYVVLLWLRDFFLSLYLDPRFRPLLLKFVLLHEPIRPLILELEPFGRPKPRCAPKKTGDARHGGKTWLACCRGFTRIWELMPLEDVAMIAMVSEVPVKGLLYYIHIKL